MQVLQENFSTNVLQRTGGHAAPGPDARLRALGLVIVKCGRRVIITHKASNIQLDQDHNYLVLDADNRR